MNDSYVIFSDSGCDLSEAICRQYGIRVIPMSFTIDGKTYYGSHDSEMDAPTFYAAQRNGAVGTTASISIGEYEDAFRSALEEGKGVLYIGFSSGLSGSVHVAEIAAAGLREEYPGQIYVIDSLSASLGLGLLCTYAAKKQQAGVDLAALAADLDERRHRMNHWFTVGDLQYLKRTGRISAASAMIGGMLNIKPFLHCDENGKLVSVGKVRGINAAVKEIVGKALESDEDITKQTVYICHSDCIEQAKMVEAALHENGVTDTMIDYIGPVIGCHCGPGTFAVFFFAKER